MKIETDSQYAVNFIVSLKTPLLSKTISKTTNLFSVKSFQIFKFIHV